MNVGRAAHTATLLFDGRVLVVGASRGFPNSAELYDPATENWSFTGSTTTPRFGYHTATLLPNGKVLVAGGYDSIGHISANAELYDPATGTWTATGSLVTARQDHTATLLANGKVLVAGGTNNGCTGKRGTLRPGHRKLDADRQPQCCPLAPYRNIALRWRVLVTGGAFRTTALSGAEIYDPATGNWTVTGTLNNARSLHTATLLSVGFVLVAGGNSNAGFLASAELYNPGPAIDCP